MSYIYLFIFNNLNLNLTCKNALHLSSGFFRMPPYTQKGLRALSLLVRAVIVKAAALTVGDSFDSSSDSSVSEQQMHIAVSVGDERFADAFDSASIMFAEGERRARPPPITPPPPSPALALMSTASTWNSGRTVLNSVRT